MRNKFPGYFLPRKVEFDDIWKRGLVIPDTNILLHLLRFRRETRDEIVKTLKALQAQLWLPRQVAYEFSRKWIEVEEENRGSYNKLKEGIVAHGNALGQLFEGVGRFQIVDAAAEKSKIDKFVKELCKSIDEAAKSHPSADEVEEITDDLVALFGDSIGDAPTAEVLDGWKSEAAQRFAARIPPGYKDDKKEGDEKFGDYIIWREMIEVAKARQLPVLFLSDDRKEDWASIRGGMDKGPRPELMQEFWEITGQRFYSYPLTAFLERAKEYTKVAVSKKAIQDVENRARRQRENLRREEQLLRYMDTPLPLATLEKFRKQYDLGSRLPEFPDELQKFYELEKLSQRAITLSELQKKYEKITSPLEELGKRYELQQLIDQQINSTDALKRKLDYISPLEAYRLKLDLDRPVNPQTPTEKASTMREADSQEAKKNPKPSEES